MALMSECLYQNGEEHERENIFVILMMGINVNTSFTTSFTEGAL
jgi:hypothetical protein